MQIVIFMNDNYNLKHNEIMPTQQFVPVKWNDS